jgi:hypothetical protein
MGPNLSRLFEEAKKPPYEKRDGYTVITDAAVANIKLDILLRTHGEALIAALEKLQDECLASDFNEHWESYTDARKLRAQLEVEAQP